MIMSEGSMKEMAELLRKGASMLSETCPRCGTPLFELPGGEIICPMCQRPVKIVSGETDEEDIEAQGSLEETLRKKINLVQGMLEEETETVKMRELIQTLLLLLDARDRVRKLS
ncbi:hypothetical protein GF319_08835 [Candidatus Bathyarchaeota archaeon]|nr:hypothetical protein [Candidatus Bathyarchaeota archaeon]